MAATNSTGQAAAPGAAPASSAAPQRVQRTRAVTMTRFVKVFTDLEYDLIDALRADDKATLDRLVSPEFEQRESTRPAEPVPREDWVKANDTKSPGIANMNSMAVHDRGELALVSFRLRLQDKDQFIVDVWRRKGADAYELLTRYVSSTPAAPVAAPAPPARASAPDGKG
ncbi:MAG TPA: hypothetical protein VGQ91_07290 [Ideonella sp.]|jgi:hypothetical protein|nr:hypothetical protein [Ideonella sp.]